LYNVQINPGIKFSTTFLKAVCGFMQIMQEFHAARDSKMSALRPLVTNEKEQFSPKNAEVFVKLSSNS
jgi:hypothetical protein